MSKTKSCGITDVNSARDTLPLGASRGAGGVWRWTAIALLCAVVQTTMKPQSVAAQELLVQYSVVPPWEPEEVPPPPPCKTKTCEKLEQQLKSECSAHSDIPFAETHYERQGLTASLSPQQRRLIALAYLSGSSAFAQRALAQALTSTKEPEFQYIAGLALANVSLKSGESPLSSAFVTGLDAMRSADPLGPDFLFLDALNLHAAGRDGSAQLRLQEALQTDPRHFTALVTAIKWKLTRVRQDQSRSTGSCRAAYDEMFSSLSALMDLEPCRFMAGHVSVLLRRDYVDPDGTAALQSALVYTSILAGRTDAARIARDRFAAVDGVACTRDIQRALDGFLSLVKQEP